MSFPVFVVTGICLLFACGAGDVGGKILICSACALIWVMGLNGKWQREEDACRDWVYARMIYHQGNYTAANEAYRKLYPQLEERGDSCLNMGIVCISPVVMINLICFWNRLSYIVLIQWY